MKGVVAVKNKEAVEMVFLNAAELVKQGRTDELLLSIAKSGINDGKLYDLWCDNCGSECSCEEFCSDAAQLECIRRFLVRDVPET
jgi:hypothetical protein